MQRPFELPKQGRTNACTPIALTILAMFVKRVTLDWRELYRIGGNRGISFPYACTVAANSCPPLKFSWQLMHDSKQVEHLFLDRWRPFCFAFNKCNFVSRELRRRTVLTNIGVPHAYCAIKRRDGKIYAVDGYSHKNGAYMFDMARMVSELSVSPLEVVFLE